MVKRILRKYGYPPDKPGQGHADGLGTGGIVVRGMGSVRKKSKTNPKRPARAAVKLTAPAPWPATRRPLAASTQDTPADAGQATLAEPSKAAPMDMGSAGLIDDTTDPAYRVAHDAIFSDALLRDPSVKKLENEFEKFTSRRSWTVILDAAKKLNEQGQVHEVYRALKAKLDTFVDVKEAVESRARRIHSEHADELEYPVEGPPSPERLAHARRPGGPQAQLNAINVLWEPVRNRADKVTHLLLGVELPWSEALGVKSGELRHAMGRFASGDKTARLEIDAASRRLGIEIAVRKAQPELAIAEIVRKPESGTLTLATVPLEPDASWIKTKVLTLPNFLDIVIPTSPDRKTIRNNWTNRIWRAETAGDSGRVQIQKYKGPYFLINYLVRILRTDQDFPDDALKLLESKFGRDAIK